MFENLLVNFKTKIHLNRLHADDRCGDDDQDKSSKWRPVALNFLQRIARKSYSAVAQHNGNDDHGDDYYGGGCRTMLPRVYESTGHHAWGPIDWEPHEKRTEDLDNVVDKFCRSIRPEGRRCQRRSQTNGSMDRFFKVNTSIIQA